MIKRKIMKHILKYLFIIVIITFLGSCKKDFLELKPASQLSFDIAITDEASMGAALNGAYADLRATNLFGRSIPVSGDLLADNIYVSSKNSGRYIPQYNYQITVSDGVAAGLWASGYNTILRANLIIDKSGLTGTKVSQYVGEAYAIRALTYFFLVRSFARPYTDNPSAMGVPIVTKFDPESKPARNSVAEVYTQILTDIDAAVSKVAATGKSSVFTREAVKALKANVLFYKGDYASAKTLALDVINNGGYTLVTAANLRSYWSDPKSRTDKVETLFEVSADPLNNNNFDALAYIYQQTGYGDMLATDDLYNLYNATDKRRDLILNSVRAGTSTQAYIVNKYVNASPGLSRDDDTKVLRLSEVYLIAAESAARTGDEPTALMLLNTLLSKRDPAFVGYTSSGAQLIEDIITERRKELAFEGNRWFDLNRLKRDIIRNYQYPPSVRSILYSDHRRIMPIPQAETDANKNIIQNPTY